MEQAECGVGAAKSIEGDAAYSGRVCPTSDGPQLHLQPLGAASTRHRWDTMK